MVSMNASDILNMLGTQSSDCRKIDCISTDSRSTGDTSIFVALCGEKFDGHDFVEQALQNGALYAVVQKSPVISEGFSNQLVFVEDTKQALMDIANLYRKSRNVKITAVTGSVGKTSTKEMIATVLAEQFETLKTQANLNNEIGVSKTLLELTNEHKAAVIEMGMDHFGEIKKMSRCVQPDIGVVTTIGVSHMENLGSREGILKAKMEIRSGLKEGNPLVICSDNDLLEDFKDSRFKIYTYGIMEKSCCELPDVTAKNITPKGLRTEFDIIYKDKSYHAVLPAVGDHNVLNALCGFMVGILYGIEPQNIVSAISKYKTSGMRQKIVTHNGFTIVEDCYNASPDSMYAAIDALSKIESKNKKILVISDMLELGKEEAKLHALVGKAASEKNIDQIFCTGKLAQHYSDMVEDKSKIIHLESKDVLFSRLKKELEPDCWVWFKASRGMRLEEVIDKIYKEC